LTLAIGSRGPTWGNLSTGLNGALSAISETASNRVFFAVGGNGTILTGP